MSQRDLHFTVCIGVSCLTPALSAEDLVKVADAALYKAKQAGKNQVAGPGRRKESRPGSVPEAGRAIFFSHVLKFFLLDSISSD